jgi:hypothetical protein
MRPRHVAILLAIMIVAIAAALRLWLGPVGLDAKLARSTEGREARSPARATAATGAGAATRVTPVQLLRAEERSATRARRVEAAVAVRARDVLVEGTGKVARVLRDDLEGSRHQRFLLVLTDGTTVLIAHNIDLAPRLEGLRVGDTVRFRGEYEWNEKGGVVHWTHHDPAGRHPGGWLEAAGRRVE